MSDRGHLNLSPHCSLRYRLSFPTSTSLHFSSAEHREFVSVEYKKNRQYEGCMGSRNPNDRRHEFMSKLKGNFDENY